MWKYNFIIYLLSSDDFSSWICYYVYCQLKFFFFFIVTTIVLFLSINKEQREIKNQNYIYAKFHIYSCRYLYWCSHFFVWIWATAYCTFISFWHSCMACLLATNIQVLFVGECLLHFWKIILSDIYFFVDRVSFLFQYFEYASLQLLASMDFDEKSALILCRVPAIFRILPLCLLLQFIIMYLNFDLF